MNMEPKDLPRTEDWYSDHKIRKFLGNPYPIGELAKLLYKNTVRISRKHGELTKYLPKKTVLNEITPKYTLGFVGDLMEMNVYDLRLSPEVVAFFDVDLFVANFEGTITDKKKVLLAQKHNEKIIDVLKRIQSPEQTVLSLSNNHGGDFGLEAFERSRALLHDHGFNTIGRRDQPSFSYENKIQVVNGTMWSNQQACTYLSRFDEVISTYDSDQFSIFYPHWFYELELYPRPEEIQMVHDLLKNWQLIVGHHSHVPQPVSSFSMDGISKLVAFSLGDFCTGIDISRYKYGIILKVEIGPLLEHQAESNPSQWAVGKVEWEFVHSNWLVTKREARKKKKDPVVQVEVVEKCPFFRGDL